MKFFDSDMSFSYNELIDALGVSVLIELKMDWQPPGCKQVLYLKILHLL